MSIKKNDSNILINELKKIDCIYLNINENATNSKHFYNLLYLNSDFLMQTFLCLKSYNKHKKTLKNYINFVGGSFDFCVEYSNNQLLKSEEDYIISLIGVSIVWAFNETSDVKYSDDNLNLPIAHDSYALLNEVILFVNSYKIWNSSLKRHNYCSIEINKKDHNAVIFKILSILTSQKIIFSNLKYIPWKKKNQINYFSEFFKKKKNLKIFNTPFLIKKDKNYSFLFGDHYSSYWDMLIPNSRSNSVFNSKNQDYDLTLGSLWTNIDFTLLKEFYEIYLQEHELKNEEVCKIYDEYIEELKVSIRFENKDLMISIGQKLSILQKALNLKILLSEDFPIDTVFYLPWKYDFRGRVYFFSDISFTFNKEFRWCMYRGYHSGLNDLIPKWHPFNNKFYAILDQYVELLKGLNISIKNNESCFVLYSIIFILISLGEINKIKLGECVHIKSFILEGINIFNSANIDEYDYEDKIKIMSLKKAINDFKKDFGENKIKKRLISKDAPASVFQHLVLNFGWKNVELLKWCNLQSEEFWYDTYSFLINKWKKKYENNELLSEYFNRKSLKKTIMTSNYGVGANSAEKYFMEEVIKINQKQKKADLDNWENLKKLFKDFFTFINESDLLLRSPKEIIKYVGEDKGYIKLTDAIIDANYYKKGESYIIDFQNENRRYTKSFSVLTELVDYNKYEISIRANFVQSLDSALTRWLISNKAFYTIHDCFLVEYCDMIYFMSLVNEGMGQKFHNFHKTWEKEKTEIFSIFILL